MGCHDFLVCMQEDTSTHDVLGCVWKDTNAMWENTNASVCRKTPTQCYTNMHVWGKTLACVWVCVCVSCPISSLPKKLATLFLTNYVLPCFQNLSPLDLLVVLIPSSKHLLWSSKTYSYDLKRFSFVIYSHLHPSPPMLFRDWLMHSW
jgi:hypothetical protein